MIIANPQIEEGKCYNSIQEQFPKLYWKNFDGKYERIKDISIDFVDGNWEIQTDSNDLDWITKKVKEFLQKEKEKNEKILAEAKAKLKAIEEAM